MLLPQARYFKIIPGSDIMFVKLGTKSMIFIWFAVGLFTKDIFEDVDHGA